MNGAIIDQRGAVRWGRLLVVLLAAGAFALGLAWNDYRRFAATPLEVPGAAATIDIARGSAFKDIVRLLRDRRATTAAPLYWRLLAERMGVTDRLHAGEYALSPGITPRELLRRMAAGEVLEHRFTIVDGWTFSQLRAALAAETGLAQTLPDVSDQAIAERLAIADGKLEGRFLPETYAWVKGESDFDVLRRAHAAMQKLLAAAWPGRAPDLPLDSPYQALILASIVEKETGRAAERAQIAGVFVRRLERGMLLQTDPTVIYGLGTAYDGNLRKHDLETDTPFNTYLRAGLPPTPVALPGKPAIEAALHPAPGNALYFVARGDGSHEFSATLEAHNRAVDKFQRHRQR
ncbi:MAG TPA: endolytic transglycosylase MltG [Rhodanobacteraceae bacterium]|nr:endolytic transglycosylase MltG [Rhodanobacteraceae bacterium]